MGMTQAQMAEALNGAKVPTPSRYSGKLSGSVEHKNKQTVGPYKNAIGKWSQTQVSRTLKLISEMERRRWPLLAKMEERAHHITNVELPDAEQRVAVLERLPLPNGDLKKIRSTIRKLEMSRQHVPEELILARERLTLRAHVRALVRERQRLVRVASEQDPSEVRAKVVAGQG